MSSYNHGMRKERVKKACYPTPREVWTIVTCKHLELNKAKNVSLN